MTTKYKHCCPDMADAIDNDTTYLKYSPKLREYAIYLHHKKGIICLIYYCPWCSKELPKHLRAEWFDLLESEHNIDDPWNYKQEQLIPAEFQTDEWWIKRGL